MAVVIIIISEPPGYVWLGSEAGAGVEVGVGMWAEGAVSGPELRPPGTECHHPDGQLH